MKKMVCFGVLLAHSVFGLTYAPVSKEVFVAEVPRSLVARYGDREVDGMQVSVRNISHPVKILPISFAQSACERSSAQRDTWYELASDQSRTFWSGMQEIKKKFRDCELKEFRINGPQVQSVLNLTRQNSDAGNGYYVEVVDTGVRQIGFNDKHAFGDGTVMKPANDQQADKWNKRSIIYVDSGASGTEIQVANLTDEAYFVVIDADNTCAGASGLPGKKYDLAAYTQQNFKTGQLKKKPCVASIGIYDAQGNLKSTLRNMGGNKVWRIEFVKAADDQLAVLRVYQDR